MSLAFFQVTLAGDRSYQPYLNAAYAEYLSRNQEFSMLRTHEASKD